MKKKWQGKSLGGPWRYTLFYTLIRYGGWRLGYLLLAFVVTYYAINPHIAKTCMPYLSRRFPGASALRNFVHRWRLQWNFGRVLVDRACIGIHNNLIPHFAKKDADTLISIIEENKGLIILSAHVGAWQTAMLPLGEVLKRPITVVLHKDDGDFDKHYYEHNKANPFEYIDPTMGHKTGLAIAKTLTSGKILAFMGDRSYEDNTNVANIPFLGHSVCLPWGIFHAASMTGSPIAICLTSRIAPCQVHYAIKGILRLPPRLGKDVDAYIPYLTQFVKVMEDFTDEHPYQFFNFFDMWSNY